jgi:hypothetical protein
VPKHGYFVEASFGVGWKCNRGYRAKNNQCLTVIAPVNGYFDESSRETGWKCERGYRVIKEKCIAVRVPKYAHLDYSGNDWECNQPYRKQQNLCVKE